MWYTSVDTVLRTYDRASGWQIPKSGSAAYSDLFNNNSNYWNIKPNYANFSELPSSVDKQTQQRKPNSIKYLGKWILATPNAKQVEELMNLYVRRNGNFTFTK